MGSSSQSTKAITAVLTAVTDSNYFAGKPRISTPYGIPWVTLIEAKLTTGDGHVTFSICSAKSDRVEIGYLPASDQVADSLVKSVMLAL